MKICIAGWYFYEPLLAAVRESGFTAFVVKNREGDTHGIPSMLSQRMSETGGRGLEFGCYQQYLMGHWDGESDVLFMQDDGEIHGTALDDIAALVDKAEIDHAFIFRDEYEEFMNAGHSGRALWCRGSLLQQIKADGGFLVDWDNCGDTVSRQANYGVHMMSKRMTENRKGNWIAIIPGLHMGRRGWLATKPWQYKRTSAMGLVTPPSEL